MAKVVEGRAFWKLLGLCGSLKEKQRSLPGACRARSSCSQMCFFLSLSLRVVKGLLEGDFEACTGSLWQQLLLNGALGRN